jgi:hypothetical protein
MNLGGIVRASPSIPPFFIVDHLPIIGRKMELSITTGADGLGLVAYYDTTNGNLNVAHLSNALGIPFTRRR